MNAKHATAEGRTVGGGVGRGGRGEEGMGKVGGWAKGRGGWDGKGCCCPPSPPEASRCGMQGPHSSIALGTHIVLRPLCMLRPHKDRAASPHVGKQQMSMGLLGGEAECSAVWVVPARAPPNRHDSNIVLCAVDMAQARGCCRGQVWVC